MKQVGWWVAVTSTTFSVGLVFVFFIGMGGALDNVVAGDERISFLVTIPPALLVATIAGARVGTQSFLRALMMGVAAVLAGTLAAAIAILVGADDPLAALMFVVVWLVVFLVWTWIKRPASLRPEAAEGQAA